ISPAHSFFFLTATATTEIYTLSLHDALPILAAGAYYLAINAALKEDPALAVKGACFSAVFAVPGALTWLFGGRRPGDWAMYAIRSEEHTSELQSRENLVCRLLLEKKKNKTRT